MIPTFRSQLRHYFLRSLYHRGLGGPREKSLDAVLAADLVMLGGMAGEW
jgi:hypothetical protein